MDVGNRVRVKICCISSVDEAHAAVAAGADALGLVSEMPSGPGVISESNIAGIVDAVPPSVSTFLLTSKTIAEDIVAQQKRCRNNVLQLVDDVAPAHHKALKHQLPGISLVQVVHVLDQDSIAQATAYARHVDALLLDSGNPTLAIKELGGTGRTHNWALSREIVRNVSVPVFLAGGLHPQNVKQAISQVKPFGVDICSGVRSRGKLDVRKLGAFFDALH